MTTLIFTKQKVYQRFLVAEPQENSCHIVILLQGFHGIGAMDSMMIPKLVDSFCLINPDPQETSELNFYAAMQCFSHLYLPAAG